MSGFRLIWGVVLVAVAALIAPSSAGATQTFPGANGSLVSAAGTFGNCLLLIDPAGGGQTQPGACFDDATPIAVAPDGKRVGGLRYDFDADRNDIKVVDLNGSNSVVFQGYTYEYISSAFSLDGASVLISYYNHYSACCGTFESNYVANAADGSPLYGAPSDYNITVAWSGTNRFAYTSAPFDIPADRLYVTPASTAVFQVSSGQLSQMDWSPLGDRIVLTHVASSTAQVVTLNPDGTGVQYLGVGGSISWSPDGQKILYGAGGTLRTMNPDGTGVVDLGVSGGSALWSPDSQKIAYRASGDGLIHVINRDGTGDVPVPGTSGKALYAWQPILKGYPRPKAATPLFLPLVPAYAACDAGSATKTHAPPLAYGSCTAAQTSNQLTVGSFDANGKAANSTAYIRMVRLGDLTTPADDSDLRLVSEITDVRNKSDLSDYTGELRAKLDLRITDKLNTPYPGGPGPGTVADTTFSFTIPCAATPDTAIGSQCFLDTTADTVLPGIAPENRRAIWETDQVKVYDGGPDGDAETGPNTLFMVQGVFAP